jgi:NAD(P)-dependent dehydrogenase (short-subunit alcohol dehydrogenase family)
MARRLSGKVAIITGGSTGIGKGIAQIFVKEGAKTVICSRSTEELKNTVNDLKSEDGEIAGWNCDVTKSREVEDLVKKTVGKFGKLDILVNNAGKNPARTFTVEDLTEEEWEEYLSINAKGTWLASKYAIPEIRKAGGGSIIMISSISAHIGQNLTGCYNSSKAAQEGLVRSMAMDYAKDNIRVNSICPGWVITDRTREVREKMIREIEKMHIIGRIGTPEDIGWAAVYLASDESTWVTGASFAIDGGYMAK